MKCEVHVLKWNTMKFVYSFALFLSLSLIGSFEAFQLHTVPTTSRQGERRPASLSSQASSNNYLSSLSNVQGGIPSSGPPKPQPPETHPLEPQPPEPLPEGVSIYGGDSVTTFTHAPFSYFAVDKLTPKGPRANADVGQPHDATRPLVSIGSTCSTSVGSWWCSEGGWPSLALRPTTEVFFVFSGIGRVTDLDGMWHEFGPGDTVILPKGWSGRWDIIEPIHKVWVVHDHARIEETSNPIRAVVAPYSNLEPEYMDPQGERPDAIHGSPHTALQTIYSVGPMQVGCWMCTPGSFPVVRHPETECFHVLDGVFFLTNADGSARRCVAGDTVVLPKGWTGVWDVIETVRKLWVVVD